MAVYRLPSENMGGQGVVLMHNQLSELLENTNSRYSLFNWTGDTITGELDASHVIKLYFRPADMKSEIKFLSSVKPLAVTYFDETHPRGMLLCDNNTRLQVKYDAKTTYSWPVNNTRFVVYKKLQPISEAIKTIKTEIDIFNKVINPLRAHVDFLHRSQYYHRDIKPENIMYDTATQKAVLIDFGLSKSLQEFSVPLKGITGTYQFVSPVHVYLTCFDLPLFRQLSKHQSTNARSNVLFQLYKKDYINILNHGENIVNQLDKIHEVNSINFILETLPSANWSVDVIMEANDRFALARSIAEIFDDKIPLPNLNDKHEWFIKYVSMLKQADEIRDSCIQIIQNHSTRHGGSIKATKQLKIKRVIIE